MVRIGWSVLLSGVYNPSALNDYFVVGSLVLLCVALLGRSPRLSKWLEKYRPLSDDSPYAFWKGIISCLILAAILILCLIGVNSMKGAVGKGPINVAILVLLAGDLLGLWSGVKRFRLAKRQASRDQ